MYNLINLERCVTGHDHSLFHDDHAVIMSCFMTIVNPGYEYFFMNEFVHLWDLLLFSPHISFNTEKISLAACLLEDSFPNHAILQNCIILTCNVFKAKN